MPNYAWIAEMLVIFPLLGIDAFKSAHSQATTVQNEQTEPQLTLYLNERGVEGTGREVADGFVVLKDSLARVEETVSIHDYMREQRQLLQERGALPPVNVKLVFTPRISAFHPLLRRQVYWSAAALMGGVPVKTPAVKP